MMKVDAQRGVGGFKFGMNREEVARVAGMVARRGRRNEFETSDYDFFEPLGVFVRYDAADRAFAVETMPECPVEYDGYALFGHPATEVLEWAKRQDPQLEIDEAVGFTSRKLGLSMYAPWVGESDLEEDQQQEPAEAFTVFNDAYWQAEQALLAQHGLGRG